MKTRTPLTLGSPDSPLAGSQARAVLRRLQEAHPRLACSHLPISLPEPVAGAGVPFLSEPPAVAAAMDARLAAGEFRLLSRYGTDLRLPLATGLVRAAVLERTTPYDAFLNRDGRITDDMPAGALIGVLNLRARAQMLALWPQLEVRLLAGGVELAVESMMRQRLIDGLVLPAAAAEHLGIQALVTEIYYPEMMLPGGGQGIVVLLARADDEEARELARALHSPATSLELDAELAFMERVSTDQDVPAGVLARVEGRRVEITAAIASPSGTSVNRAAREGPAAQAAQLGAALAEQLLLDANTLLSLLEADFPEGLPAGELDEEVAARLESNGYDGEDPAADFPVLEDEPADADPLTGAGLGDDDDDDDDEGGDPDRA